MNSNRASPTSTSEAGFTTSIGTFADVISIVNRIESEGRAYGGKVRVVFLRNITIEGIEPFLKYHLYSCGLRPEIVFGGYGTIVQDVVSAEGPIAKSQPDLIVLSLLLEELDSAFPAPGWNCGSVRDQLENILGTLASATNSTIAINTFFTPLYPETGLAISRDETDLSGQIAQLNRFLIQYAKQHAPRFWLIDWDRYLRRLGADETFDYRYWYLAKAPLRIPFLNLYAQDLARVLRVLKGYLKKCLILDCDNTLWGGVVGEEGIDGIKLDRDTYPGKAYYDFQTSVLHLAQRGVIITLCSKNEEADVFGVLENHPSCRIKRPHLSGWRINWDDKVTNIRSLAQELNLGLESFVLVDDSPVECEMVKRMLPEVTVLQVPQQLYTYPHLLLRDGLFDSLVLTSEDSTRAALYQSESERKKIRSEFATVEDYLASLNTAARIHRALPSELPRVAQLIQKTNQFNVTTKRYSPHEIETMATQEDRRVYTLSAHDKFGELGLIGVLILCREGALGRVDTFLMSCRALGRGLERAMLAYCLETMQREWAIDIWRAEYLPTLKNVQAAEFFSNNGFAEVCNVDGHKIYELVAAKSKWTPLGYISVEPN